MFSCSTSFYQITLPNLNFTVVDLPFQSFDKKFGFFFFWVGVGTEGEDTEKV